MAPPSAPTPAGYSGTPLAKKLGLKAASRVWVVGAPAHYRELLEPLPPDLVWQEQLDAQTDVIHHFSTESAELAAAVAHYRSAASPHTVLWISWPKKTARPPDRLETDITEDTVRELALPLGWVDIKVCAVDATWSGLKLVVRKELRPR